MKKLILSNNLTGYIAHAMFRWCNYEETKVVYEDKLDWTRLNDYIDPDDDEIYIVGIPYFRSYDFSRVALSHSQFVYHMASFGDEIQVPFNSPLVSTVSLTESPLLTLRNHLREDEETGNKMLLDELAVAHNQYHTYTFDDTTDKIPLDLALLGNFFKDNLSMLAEGCPNSLSILRDRSYVVLKSLRANMEAYIGKKEAQTKTYTVTYGGKYYNVAFVYAEEFQNELAHHLLKDFQSRKFDHLVVLVGSHTQSNDRLAVRTTADVDASLIAKAINGGKGKPQAASVFLSDTPSANFNIIIQQLETAMSKGVL